MTPPSSKPFDSPLSVLLVEGDTEQLFYDRVVAEFLGDSPRITIDEIGGIWNVNLKILSKITSKYDTQPVRIYCCLDRESRNGKVPGLNLEYVRKEIVGRGLRGVLSIDSVIATQMIESWFFHDLEGIYSYLRAKRSLRNLKAFSPPERYGKVDLKRLFRRFGKVYREGDRAEHFIGSLDMNRILSGCTDLQRGVKLIRRQASSFASKLFPQ